MQHLDCIHALHYAECGCVSHNIACFEKVCTDLDYEAIFGKFLCISVSVSCLHWRERNATLLTSLFELAPVEHISCCHLDWAIALIFVPIFWREKEPSPHYCMHETIEVTHAHNPCVYTYFHRTRGRSARGQCPWSSFGGSVPCNWQRWCVLQTPRNSAVRQFWHSGHSWDCRITWHAPKLLCIIKIWSITFRRPYCTQHDQLSLEWLGCHLGAQYSVLLIHPSL